MSFRFGPQAAVPSTNGVMILDAANTDSYPGTVNFSVWYDLTVNENNATLINSPTFDSSDGQGSIVLDGTDDYILFNSPGISNTTDFTWSIWVKPTAGSYFSDYSIIATAGSLNQNGNIHFRNNVSNWEVRFEESGADLTTTTTFTTGNWYNIVLTYDYDGSKQFYINGSAGVSNAASGNTFTWTQMGETGGGLNTLEGKFGRVAVYDTALSSAQVLHNYNLFKLRYGL